MTKIDYKHLIIKYFQEYSKITNSWPRIQERLVRLDGISIVLEISATIIQYNKSKAVLIIARDISERKRIENLRKDTERIFRHDLKTPIIGMINVTEGLMDRLLENENYEYIKLIFIILAKFQKKLEIYFLISIQLTVKQMALVLAPTVPC